MRLARLLNQPSRTDHRQSAFAIPAQRTMKFTAALVLLSLSLGIAAAPVEGTSESDSGGQFWPGFPWRSSHHHRHIHSHFSWFRRGRRLWTGPPPRPIKTDPPRPRPPPRPIETDPPRPRPVPPASSVSTPAPSPAPSYAPDPEQPSCECADSSLTTKACKIATGTSQLISCQFESTTDPRLQVFMEACNLIGGCII